jgi:phage terminase large subunit-like protein
MTVAEAQTPEVIIEEPFKLTHKQDEALTLIGADALYCLLFGGSRSTKTFTIVRTIVWRALAVPNSRHAILRFRFSHVKKSIAMDTFPKVMKLCFPECPFRLNKSDWCITFGNGSEIWFGGLDDKERTEKILGLEYASIFLNECSQISYNSFLMMVTRLAQMCHYVRKGVKKQLRLKMFLDENPPTKGHWTHKLFVDFKEPESSSMLEDPENYSSLLMNPIDNLENLPDSYIQALQKMPKRKRDRFWLGKFADDSENALWTSEMIEKARVTTIPEDALPFVRIVVAVDPSGAGDTDNENNDEIGIGVCALGSDGLGYVLEDLTLLAGPKKWGGVAASAYNRHKADRVVGETNYGGAMVEFTVRAADPNISYKGVNASRGKVVRAEPISALTELGKIKFVGRFDELEDELCSFTTTGYIGEKSPNRADWMVWGMTELFPGMTQRDKKERKPLTIPRKKRI